MIEKFERSMLNVSYAMMLYIQEKSNFLSIKISVQYNTLLFGKITSFV